MELSDFDYNEDKLEKELRKADTGFRRAKEYFFDRFDHWHRLIDVKLSKNVVLNEDPEANKASGEVLGKQFALHLSPVFRGEHGLAAVLLTLKDPVNGKAIELDRFYVDVNGDVLSKEGETLLNSQDDLASIKLFYAILRRVLKAEPWA